MSVTINDILKGLWGSEEKPKVLITYGEYQPKELKIKEEHLYFSIVNDAETHMQNMTKKFNGEGECIPFPIDSYDHGVELIRQLTEQLKVDFNEDIPKTGFDENKQLYILIYRHVIFE